MISYSSVIRPMKQLLIGDNFYSCSYSHFVTNLAVNVKNGDYVMSGPYCIILAGNHNIEVSDSHLMQENPSHFMSNPEEIVIGDGVLVGSGCIILTKAINSEGVVIGADSVVNKYLPPYTICFGNPFNVKKRRLKDNTSLGHVLRKTESGYSLKHILIK